MGLDSDLTFIHAELTKAATEPHLAQFKELMMQSLEAGLESARAAGGRAPAVAR
jgi:hypothetical protein